MVLFRLTAALAGPAPTNVDFSKDAIGGSMSNASFCHYLPIDRVKVRSCQASRSTV